jgi:tetratricopeptide (TPR) repeat protein
MKKKKNNQQSRASKKSTNRTKVWVLKAIAILFPFLLLLFLELSLRLFHYGFNPGLFIPYKSDAKYLVFNPEASRKYFIDPQSATTGNIELFKKKKDHNTCRIFVLGESTTIGYPYFYNGSFHRWLQYRLMHTFPERNFEIINLSLTAVNSYTILGFAQELIDYEPDAVLIYAGQNEYYGALGVGSTQMISGSPAFVNTIIDLRRLKIVQLLTNVYHQFYQLFSSKKADTAEVRMKIMVKNQAIPYKSILYQRGIDQFKYNMSRTLRLFRDKGIPVFMSDLVSNEKDLPPFVSTTDKKNIPETFTGKFNQGMKALSTEETLRATVLLKEADQAYPDHALCNFYLGQLVYNQGDFRNAKKYLVKAKDLDMLRFRASEELNETIRQLCMEYKNTRLVATKEEFEKHSPHQIIGNNLITDHVHPNLPGYALMSNAFYNAMKGDGPIGHSNPENEISFEELLKDMPITKVDSLAGAYRIYNLKGRWPFNDSLYKKMPPVKTFEEMLAHKLAFEKIDWLTAHKNLFTYYVENKRLPEASKVTEAIVLENPTVPEFYEIAAKLKMQLKDYEGSLFYSQEMFYHSPSFKVAKYLFIGYLKLDLPSKALPFLDYAIANNTEGSDLNPLRASVNLIIQLQKALAADPSNLDAVTGIANAYLHMHNNDGAIKYFTIALKLDPKNKKVQVNLKNLNEEGKNDVKD